MSIATVKPTGMVMGKEQKHLPKWFTPAALILALGIALMLFVVGKDTPNYIGGGFIGSIIFLIISGIAGYAVEGRRYGSNRGA